MVRIALTNTGQEVLDRVLEMESIQEIMAGLSETKRDQLEGCLEILYRRALRIIESGKDSKENTKLPVLNSNKFNPGFYRDAILW
jgi:hypothetical protein